MKSKLYPTLLALVAPLTLLTAGCERRDEAAPPQGNRIAPSFEELTTAVPETFWQAAQWNDPASCPEGATLSRLTRYSVDSGAPVSYGERETREFKFYYGRSCEIVREPEPDLLQQRGLASADGHGVGTLPHGPFAWWYEDGRPMEAGSFIHGTLSGTVARYSHSGKLVALED